MSLWAGRKKFQSPEGDSLFFYYFVMVQTIRDRISVSVPRRGFVVFLPASLGSRVARSGGSFSPPKGIRCFSTSERKGGKRGEK